MKKIFFSIEKTTQVSKNALASQLAVKSTVGHYKLLQSVGKSHEIQDHHEERDKQSNLHDSR